MKKIIFLIIASLLVLGLVLPGCEDEGPEFENWVTVGVVGPLSFIQGRDHVAGAKLAVEEINDAGGVTVGTTVYGIKLVTRDTNEILDTSGVDGTTALTGIIEDVDFVIGGFRTESLIVYREVAVGPKGAGVIFIDCGAASNELQESVLTDYENYKYWFKGTPYNSTFLFLNTLKQAVTLNSKLRAAAGMNASDPATTIGVIVEDAEWTGAFSLKLPIYLPAYGFNVTGLVQKPKSDATDVTTELEALKTACPPDGPMMVFTVLSGPPGAAYGMKQPSILPYSFSTGINVEAQDIDYYHATKAGYHCGLDTWGMDVALTDNTLDFLDAYMEETGRYPTYCAATYDTINVLALAIADVGGFDSTKTDAIIAWLEDLDHAYTGVAATTGYYPMPDEGPFEPIPPYGYSLPGDNPEAPAGLSTNWSALSAAQAYDIYGDGLLAYYGAAYGIANYAEMAGNWTTGLTLCAGFAASSHEGNPLASTGACLPHDTIYGPGWQTGQGVQWQPVDPAHPEDEWKKVGWWPYVVVPGLDKPAADLKPGEADTLFAYGLLDKYGNWNHAYSGSVPLVIPDVWTDHWKVS